MRRDTLANKISKMTGYEVVATDGSEYGNGHRCGWECERDGCTHQLGTSVNISDYVDLTVAVGEYDEATVKVRISQHASVYGGCDVYVRTDEAPLTKSLQIIANALIEEVESTQRIIERLTNVY